MSESFYRNTIYLVIGLFVALLLINFFFRVKVLGIYQRLRRNGVQFTFGHAFDPKRLEDEVLSKYPDHSKDITDFLRYVRLSITMASILLVLIIIAGSVLMFYR
ncbi:MAG: hypothetical protein KTR24_05825 [Saprospiraceae bacterium]|nr:hypothetical protein [Saprospiraceae bacterium]